MGRQISGQILADLLKGIFMCIFFCGLAWRGKRCFCLFYTLCSEVLGCVPAEKSDEKLLQTGPYDLCRPGRGIWADGQGGLIRIVKPAHEESPGLLHYPGQKAPVRFCDMEDCSPEKFHQRAVRRE